MAERVPLKGLFDVSGNVTGLAELSQSNSDTIGAIHGGTGLTTITANKLLTGNGTSAMSVESDLTFDGSTNTLTTPNVSISTAATLASAKVSDLTSGRLVLAGTSGELEDNTKLTFDGTTLTVTGNIVATGNFEAQTQITTTDPVLLIDSGRSGNPAAGDDSGIIIERGTDPNVSIFWDSSEEHFSFASTTDTGAGADNTIAVSDQMPIKVGTITSTGNLAISGTFTGVTDLTMAGALAGVTDLGLSGNLQFDSGQTVNEISTDATFTDGSATALVTEAAAKSYINQQASAFAIALG